MRRRFFRGVLQPSAPSAVFQLNRRLLPFPVRANFEPLSRWYRGRAREHGNTYYLISISALWSPFCFDCFVSVHRRHIIRWALRFSFVMALGNVRWKLQTRVRPLASRLARPFWPRVSCRRKTENRGVHRIVCRRCAKTKQNGDRSRNRKQFCLLLKQ